MNIFISNTTDEPIYEQIVRQIKALIMSGELKEGDALPSMRVLAQQLRISVITTKRAYEELERDGFTESFTGKGSFVCRQNPQIYREDILRNIESELTSVCAKAKTAGIGLDELCDILSMLYNGE
ncbi:MAG: GntR family transcriptional regulator [Ruminiclostridium sp.]|nr:GntR family transcriptional regulator [Ruminiclostridium sp.]